MNKFMGIISRIPFGSTTSIGLDIGTDSIKFLKLKRKGGSYELLSYGMASVSHLKTKPLEEQSAALSDILAELLKGEKKGTEIFTAVSGSQVTIKTINIPRMPKAEFEKAILWISRKHISVPLEEANFDYKILGEIEERKIIKYEVMIVAAEKDLINDQVGLYRKTGLKVGGISVTPFALWNLLGMTKTGPPSIAWLDIGARFATIAVFQDHILKFSREILTAGDSITESIKSFTSLLDEEAFSDEDAERLKKEYGLSGQDVRPEIARSITPVIVRLIDEVQRSFSFYQQRHPEVSIEKIYLTGGTARLKGLPAVMEERLGIDVEVINPFKKIKIGLSPMETAKLNELAPAFSVATGLALSGGERINLLPTEIKEQRAIAPLIPVLRVSAISLIAILSLLYLYAAAQVKADRKLLNIWKTTIQTFTAKAPAPQQIKEKIDRINRMKKTIERLEERGPIEPFILKEIANILPESIALKSLSISYFEEFQIEKTAGENRGSAGQEPAKKAMRFQIEGTVCGEEASLEVVLTRFMIALDSSPFLKNPVLMSQKRNVLNGTNVLAFELRCDLQ
ncbi:MAG: type IV pilus assembly protein PilM [Deltaproteobacteria bacterium]|nr:type IV pilus assembly protein PilM [Deltaproteobacteria bacterium]MBW2019272.1 type IV pilus assembly protein PilM [Deltaproteobacteria bacterium]MBW2074107.1 type IV pilus assembly protein PilM [Deltaproteobacteria bacterium]